MSDARCGEFVLLLSTITWCKTYTHFSLNVALPRDLTEEVSVHLTIKWSQFVKYIDFENTGKDDGHSPEVYNPIIL